MGRGRDVGVGERGKKTRPVKRGKVETGGGWKIKWGGGGQERRGWIRERGGGEQRKRKRGRGTARQHDKVNL